VNKWLSEFPGTNAGHAAAIILILLTGVIVAARLALGLPFPDGYGEWLLFVATLAGVSTAGMGIKRVTDIGYKNAGQPSVTVEAPSTVTVAAPAAGGVAAPPALAQPDPDTRGNQ
jgi:hypothetical protein